MTVQNAHKNQYSKNVATKQDDGLGTLILSMFVAFLIIASCIGYGIYNKATDIVHAEKEATNNTTPIERIPEYSVTIEDRVPSIISKGFDAIIINGQKWSKEDIDRY